VLVAADLIRDPSKPSLEDALILGLIVLIRTVLSMSIQIEIEGVLPWRRALLTSGGQVLGEQIARDRAADAARSSVTEPAGAAAAVGPDRRRSADQHPQVAEALEPLRRAGAPPAAASCAATAQARVR
jgi:hypothetical protein